MKIDEAYIQQLLDRVAAGVATQGDHLEIEELLDGGVIRPEDIESHARIEQQLLRLDAPEPSSSLDRQFYQMLSNNKSSKKAMRWSQFFQWPQLVPKFAIASVMLLVGVGAGYFLRPSADAPGDGEIAYLSRQVSDLQEMMMLSLLEKGSATERLKAVNLTQEMNEASQKVTNALIQTLSEDENINVRLAALEALKPYTTDSSVREALIRSIAKQESPLVQISLAELMVALQERSAVKEFEKIVDSDRTPAEVKKKIRETMEILI